MAYSWKRTATTAYGFSLARLALNLYLLCDSTDVDGSGAGRSPLHQEEICQGLSLLRSFLDKTLTEEQCGRLREERRQEMERLLTCSETLDIYDYVLRRVELRFRKGDAQAEALSEETLAQELCGYCAGDREELGIRMMQILRELPVRYTKQKYFENLGRALQPYVGSGREALEAAFYEIDMIVRGAMQPDEELARREPEISGLLGTLQEISYRTLTREDYERAVAAHRQASDLVDERIHICGERQDLVNDMYVLLLTGADAMHDLTEEQPSRTILRRIGELDAAGELLSPQELEQELDGLEGVQEKLLERMEQLSPAPEYREGESEEDAKGRQVERLTSTSRFASLEDSKTEGYVTGQDVEQAVGDFAERVTPLLSSLQKPVMRAVMAITLSHLPVLGQAKTAGELQALIVSRLAGCPDYAEKTASMSILHDLMENDCDAFL